MVTCLSGTTKLAPHSSPHRTELSISGEQQQQHNGGHHKMASISDKVTLQDFLQSEQQQQQYDDHHRTHSIMNEPSLPPPATTTKWQQQNSLAECDTSQNQLRDFILYRYYQSQYPELFPNAELPPPPPTNDDDDGNVECESEEKGKVLREKKPVVSRQSSYQTTTTLPKFAIQESVPFYLNNNNNNNTDNNILPEEKVANSSSKLIHVSMHRPRHKKMYIRSNTETTPDSSSTRCCFLCRCANRYQSDSSLWSLSEPDLSQMVVDATAAKQSNESNNRSSSSSRRSIVPDSNYNVNHLDPPDRYAHLSRVITPPNAFLNNTTTDASSRVAAAVGRPAVAEENYCYEFLGPTKRVSYSNKLTQTDYELDRFRLHHHQQQQQQQQQSLQQLCGKRLQRHLSLFDQQWPLSIKQQQSTDVCQTEETPYSSVNTSEHIYYMIEPNNTKVSKSGNISNINNNNTTTTTTVSTVATTTTTTATATTNTIKQQKFRSSSSSSYERNVKLLSRSRSLKSTERNQKLNEYISSGNGECCYSSLGSNSQQILLDAKSKTINEIHLKHEAAVAAATAAANAAMAGINIQENEHRNPTSNNGLPCTCERCKEWRGLNLTTELLPIDSQMPLQTMENMFQDSSMTELICTII